MNAERLLETLETLADAPNGIAQLRNLVLELAVRGRLVEQGPTDEPASALISRILATRARLVEEGQLRRTRTALTVDATDTPWAIPESWEWTRFSTIAESRLGKMLDKAKNTGQLRPYLRNANVQWFRFDLTELKELRIEEADLEEHSIHAGDLVICEGGEPGRAAVCDDHVAGMVFQKALHRARPWLGISPWYLAYVLRVDAATERLAEYFTGATIKHFTGKSLARYLVPLPPLAEQRRIVARVDELMALLDRLEAAKEARDATRVQLRDAALAALQDANDAEEVKTAWSRIADHMHDLFTEPSDIPSLRQSILHLAVSGWLVPQDAVGARIVEVREVVQFLNGYAFKSTWYTDPGVRVVRNQNVSHNTINWQDTKRVSEDRAREFDRFRLEEGDIVLSLDRPIISSGLKVATVRAEDLPCLLLQRVACPRPRDASLSRRYFLVWLNSPEFIESIDPGRSNGVPHISTRAVEAMTLRLPPVDEQNRIASKVDELMAILDRFEASLLHVFDLQEAFSVASTRTSKALNSAADRSGSEGSKVGLAESISP